MSNKFYLKKISESDMANELLTVGFDKSYYNFAAKKYEYINIKIFDLTLPQANILKQTALSLGADCAVHKDILTAKIEKTDCILGGSVSQIAKIVQNLKNQPFSMKILADKLECFIQREVNNTHKIVGILNLTKNSFSDGGMYYDFENAKIQLHKLIDDGADIIDIGAESTKAYSEPVSDEEQLKVIEPVLSYIKYSNIDIPISIDTRSSVVAKRSIELGASIINDVSGFDYDENMISVIANCDCKIIITHSAGTPDVMQNAPCYNNLIDEIYLSLQNKISKAHNAGIKKENIIIDVGIGFGKTLKDNYTLLKRIDEFKGLGCKVMIGLSRKSLLNMPDETNEVKDIMTVALNTLAIERSVDYLRVHNVLLNKKLLSVMENF